MSLPHYVAVVEFYTNFCCKVCTQLADTNMYYRDDFYRRVFFANKNSLRAS